MHIYEVLYNAHREKHKKPISYADIYKRFYVMKDTKTQDMEEFG